MKRKKALDLVQDKIENKNLIKHSLAVEAAMKALAEKFGKDEKNWALAGLLHDIDYEKTKENPGLHSKKGAEILREKGIEEKICQAVLTHNDVHKIEPEGLMAKALYCVDPLTGLIVAATLVLPSRSIKKLKTENVLNRFEEKRFAAGADREVIKKCQPYLGLELEEFVEITLKAMQKIHKELGL